MRAGMLIAPMRIELRDEAIPVADAGSIVVRIRAALTDGTDLKAYRRGHPQMPMPTRFGHEFAGDVAAVGAHVDRFAPGDAIMSVHSAPCGRCYWCAHDQHELCEHVMETKILGAYAQYVLVPSHIVACNVYPKPPHLSYEAAAFLEPLACVTHALGALAPATDARVAIVGDGGFGLLHGLVLRARGLPPPLLIGRRKARLQLARDYGFETIDARAMTVDDIASAIMTRTGGRGADAVIETTGTNDVWEAATRYVRRGATIVLFGGLPGGTRVSFDAARLHYDEIRLISPFHLTPQSVRDARDLLVAGLDVEPLVTHRFALADLASAFARLDGGDGIKFAILP